MEKPNLDEEFSQEFNDLKWQFQNMQQVLNNLEKTIDQAVNDSSNQRDFTNEFEEESRFRGKTKENTSKEGKQREGKSGKEGNRLSSQIQEFMKQTQEQQSTVQEDLQKSIQQAIDILNEANMQIQTNQALVAMNNSITQAEQQLTHISQSSKSNTNQKLSPNRISKNAQEQNRIN